MKATQNENVFCSSVEITYSVRPEALGGELLEYFFVFHAADKTYFIILNSIHGNTLMCAALIFIHLHIFVSSA